MRNTPFDNFGSRPVPGRYLGGRAKLPNTYRGNTYSVFTRDQYQPQDKFRYVAEQLGLRPDEVRFVTEYLIDLNPTGAASRSGLPAYMGFRLLARKRVAHAIAAYKACRLADSDLDPEEVLHRWSDIFHSDLNEIVQLHIVCCRYCWGEGFRYQRTQAEIEADLQEHERKFTNKPGIVFDVKGGEGYDRSRSPNPECPECHGIGDSQPLIVFCDTRYMSPGARARIESIEIGSNGAVKLKLRPMREIEEMYMRHMGQFPKPEYDRIVDPSEMSDEELTATIEKYAPYAEIVHEKPISEEMMTEATTEVVDISVEEDQI